MLTPSRLLLAAPLALAGCLSAPTGLDPTDAGPDAPSLDWPPGGVDVVALAAGDLDGDGRDDLLIADAGGGGRILMARGGVDFVPSQTLTRVTKVASVAGLRDPAAMLVHVDGATRRILVFDSPEAAERITILDADLNVTGTNTLATRIPTASEVVSLTTAPFGMSGEAVFMTTPDGAWFIERNDLGASAPQLRNTTSDGVVFDGVQMATGFVDGSPTVLVAEEEAIFSATTAGPPPWTYTQLRPLGNPWLSQVAYDLDGDQLPEIVGFAPEGVNDALLCVQPPTGSASCATTPFMNDTAVMVVGELTMPGTIDVVLVHAPPVPNTTDVFVAPNLAFDGTTTIDMPGMPERYQLDRPYVTFGHFDLTGPAAIVLMSVTGAMQCLRVSGNRTTPCST